MMPVGVMTGAKRKEHAPILLSITINSLYKDDDS